MPVSRMPIPDDPVHRRAFLEGMTSAHQGWDDLDVKAARPALAPACDWFDSGRAAGLDMAALNVRRRKNLMLGLTGRVWRIFHKKAEAKARKDAIPELP